MSGEMMKKRWDEKHADYCPRRYFTKAGLEAHGRAERVGDSEMGRGGQCTCRQNPVARSLRRLAEHDAKVRPSSRTAGLRAVE